MDVGQTETTFFSVAGVAVAYIVNDWIKTQKMKRYEEAKRELSQLSAAEQTKQTKLLRQLVKTRKKGAKRSAEAHARTHDMLSEVLQNQKNNHTKS